MTAMVGDYGHDSMCIFGGVFCFHFFFFLFPSFLCFFPLWFSDGFMLSCGKGYCWFYVGGAIAFIQFRVRTRSRLWSGFKAIG